MSSGGQKLLLSNDRPPLATYTSPTILA